MARPIDRSDPAQATAVLTEILADLQQRDAILQAFAELADVAAGIKPASWSITLKPGHIQLNVGSILVLRVSGSGLRFAGRAESTLPDEIRTHVEETSSFSIIPGVVIWKLPLAVAGNAVNVRWLTREARVVAGGAASTRGPWRRAHSPGFVTLLEQRLGRRLSWEPPSDKDPPADKDSPAEPGLLEAAIRHTKAQPYDRLVHRRRAIDAARVLIRGKLGLFDADDLRRLLGLFNLDFMGGRDKHNRFATGLVGNNANLLVAQLPAVNAAIRELWTADGAWIAQNLTVLRRGGTLPGGGWLFPTMILHTLDPERFLPLTDAMAEGLAALDGGPVVSLRTGLGYLEFCKRTLTLLTAHDISSHYSDLLLWYGQRTREPEAEAEPCASPTTAPPALPDPPRLVGAGRSQNFVPSARPTGVAEADPDEPAPSRSSPTTAPPALPDPLLLVGTPSAPPPAAAKRGSVGWLHLTDLHQGMQGTRGLWPNVMSLVFDDLAKLHDLCGPWDLVLFTGDLTQRGDADEFAELDRTLDRLWRRFEQLGSNPKLIAVPGNHDLQRPKHWYAPVPLALSQWHSHRELRDHVFDVADNPYVLELRRSFAAYTAWAARAPWFVRDGVSSGVMPGDIAASLSLHGLDIGVVGLNSSFLQLTGDYYTEKLDIHPRQLEVCGDYAPEWLQRHHINLLLTHHPPTWLDPRARQEFHHEIDSPGRFAAHFFGHMHEGAMTATRHGGGLARHTIQGSSLFGLEEHDGPHGRKMTRLHGYSAGRFEPTTASGPLDAVRVRIFPRKLVTGGSTRRIAPDHTEYDLDDRNGFSFEVPTVKRA